MDLEYGKRARKFLKKCETKLHERIMKRIKGLRENPFPHDAIPYKGKKGIFRIRVGGYRFLFEIFRTENKIIIYDIDKRSRIYTIRDEDDLEYE